MQTCCRKRTYSANDFFATDPLRSASNVVDYPAFGNHAEVKRRPERVHGKTETNFPALASLRPVRTFHLAGDGDFSKWK